MRWGVFGGTFDPIHLGHLAAAQEVAARLSLNRVVFVPARHQPLKEAPPAASDAARLAMLELAIAANPLFEVSTVDLEQAPPSYTVRTLRRLGERYPERGEPYFLLGVDAVDALPRWHEPEEVLRRARLAVMSRGGQREPDWATLRAAFPQISERAEAVAVPALAISASDLRRRMASGAPIRYQVPEAVYAYIEEHRLYQ